jgi:hypothetical protein
MTALGTLPGTRRSSRLGTSVSGPRSRAWQISSHDALEKLRVASEPSIAKTAVRLGAAGSGSSCQLAATRGSSRSSSGEHASDENTARKWPRWASSSAMNFSVKAAIKRSLDHDTGLIGTDQAYDEV